MFSLIAADDPWDFKVYSATTGGNRLPKYPCMNRRDLTRLPVGTLGDPDSLLMMWTFDPFVPDALDLLKARGYKYATIVYYWIKTNRKQVNACGEPTLFVGKGYYTRSNIEICLLGRRGDGVPRLDRGVPRVIIAPVGRHSAKPDEFYARTARLFGDLVPRIELFARHRWPGWAAWGNEVRPDVRLNKDQSAFLLRPSGQRYLAELEKKKTND